MKTEKIGLGFVVAFFLMTCFIFSTAHSQPTYPDLSIWSDQWFKVSFSLQRLHFSDIGVAPDSGMDVIKATGYLVFGIPRADPDSVPAGAPILPCAIYIINETGVWQPISFDFNYVGGDASNFASWAENLGNAFTAQVKGTQKKDGTFSGSTVKTLGGYSWEIDNVLGSTERWVGSLTFSATWVNPITLCKSSKNALLPPCQP